MIEVEHLSKSYGSVEAVRDLSFSVAKGEIVGILGPNGAGKSTTLRILAGFLGATSGRVRIGGHDIVEEPMKARAALGYLPETAPLYPEMRVREYLAFRAELKLVARAARRPAVKRAMTDAGVADVADVLIGQLSKGYRQRVGLADALVASPPLLILDEPTAGLDPNQIREARDLIRHLGEDHTVLLSTHILPEVESTCTRALVIARGSLVAEGSLDAIRAKRGAFGVRVLVRGDAARASEVARKPKGVRRVRTEAGDEVTELVVEFARGADAGALTEEVTAAIVGAGLGVRAVTPLRTSLEEVFSELTTEVAEPDAEPPGAAPSEASR